MKQDVRFVPAVHLFFKKELICVKYFTDHVSMSPPQTHNCLISDVRIWLWESERLLLWNADHPGKNATLSMPQRRLRGQISAAKMLLSQRWERRGRWGKGDGRRSQASAACRHSYLRRPSEKKNKTSTTSLKRVLPRLNLPPTKDEVVTYRMGWRQRGLPSFSMSENNKTAAMERTHSPTRQPRETRSKRREWLARDGRYDSR